MEQIDKDIGWIEQYLEGALPEPEKNKLVDRLEKDAEFRTLFQRMYASKEAIKGFEEEEADVYLDALPDDFFAADTSQVAQPKAEPKVVSIPQRPRYRRFAQIISIAATVALLLWAGTSLLAPKTDTDQLYASYYDRPAFDAQRGNDNSFAALSQAYAAQDFSTFLTLIQEREEDTELSTGLAIYKAVALLETGQEEGAIDVLDALIGGQDRLDEIYWLKAMAQLKSGAIEAAKVSLSALEGADFPVTPKRQNQATELLKKLD